MNGLSSEAGFLRSLRIGMGVDTTEDRKRILKAADKLERLEVFDLALALNEMPKHTLWCVGSMEDGPFARVVLPHPDGHYLGGYREATGSTAAEALRFALAAATGTAKTAKQAECEASQSGPKGNAQ